MYTRTLTVPIQTLYLIGREKSFLELNAGLIIAREQYEGDWHWDNVHVFFTAFIGYRYQSKKGFLFRIGAIPMLVTNNRLPWGGISFGKSF